MTVARKGFNAMVRELHDAVFRGVFPNSDSSALSTALGGGGLPDWWTVDSTEDAEKVTIGGQVTIAPPVESLHGLLINLPATFDDFANYRVAIQLAGSPQPAFILDSGGIDLTADAGAADAHILLSETDSLYNANYSSRQFVVGDGAAVQFGWAKTQSLFFTANTPSENPALSAVQIYYVATVGAPKLMIRGKDSAGTDFDAEIALT